jgi:leader peptidase (prepilin peptidase) / N-methyltransferase
MIRTFGTVLAGIAGLLFGSFLNVCVSRWPRDESIIRPASHCPHCNRALAFWENIPVLSWLVLRGRCRTCKASIGFRYPLVELGLAALWAFSVWLTIGAIFAPNPEGFGYALWMHSVNGTSQIIFLWLLVALAVLDAENFWLPDRLIWPGIVLGLVLAVARESVDAFLRLHGGFDVWKHMVAIGVAAWFLGAVIPAGGLFLIRILYLVFRRKEGVGMGDIKLMAMIGGWLGVRLAVIAFAFAVILGAVAGLVLLVRPSKSDKDEPWGAKRLPLGTFLCLGAMACSFWITPIMAAAQRWFGWAGF